jgi:hypothetical protein
MRKHLRYISSVDWGYRQPDHAAGYTAKGGYTPFAHREGTGSFSSDSFGQCAGTYCHDLNALTETPICGKINEYRGGGKELNTKKKAEVLGIVVVFTLSIWLIISGHRTAMFILLLATLVVEIWLNKKR